MVNICFVNWDLRTEDNLTGVLISWWRNSENIGIMSSSSVAMLLLQVPQMENFSLVNQSILWIFKVRYYIMLTDILEHFNFLFQISLKPLILYCLLHRHLPVWEPISHKCFHVTSIARHVHLYRWHALSSVWLGCGGRTTRSQTSTEFWCHLT